MMMETEGTRLSVTAGCLLVMMETEGTRLSVTAGCLLERVELESECMHCNDGRMHACIPQ